MEDSQNITLYTQHDACTGCSACAQSCPSGAISMKADAEGFLRATVNLDACIHCNLCNKICPVAEGKQPPPSEFISAYVAWNASLPELKLSSSGGIFSLLANRTLDDGGVVCGAVYDNQGYIHHDIADSADGLARMRGSKYVQSDMRNCFPRIRELLKAGREVLFTGTGCQVGGLKSFLRKDYPNLLTMEIICEGTPSPGVWERHLHHVCPDMAELHYLSFRDKTYGWTQTLVADYTDRAGERHKIAIPAAKEPYIKAMFAAISQARNCYDCRFREGRSGADIIIGDMWALKIVAPEAKPECGASVILCNSDRGARIVEELKPQMGYCKQISPLSAAINNGYIYRAPVIEAAARECFYQHYRAGHQLPDYLEETMQRSNRVAILNHAGHCNYGSNLTAYALQEYLRRAGYDARVVSLKPFRCPDDRIIKPYLSFINGVIRWTQDVYGPHTCAALNADFDTFIVGSDQVWRYPRPWIRRCAEPGFYLDFAAQGKRRVAYAASFGINTYQGPKRLVRRFYKALRDFDAVSVRETQGLDILRERFDYTDATQVADPVFLLSRRDWQRFASASGIEAKRNTLCYMFFFFGQKLAAPLASYADRSKLQLQLLSGGGASVMDWLSRIEHAELIVTDSFHSLCFALIFEKPFIVVTSEKYGKSRLISLLQDLGLTDRLIDADETPTEQMLDRIIDIHSNPIDYSSIRERMDAIAIRSGDWLKNAVACPVSFKKHVISPSHPIKYLEKLPLFLCKTSIKLKKLKPFIKSKLSFLSRFLRK